MKLFKHKIISISFATALALTSVFANTEMAQPASKFTMEKNQELYEQLPFKDHKDFNNAKKGFIAALPNNGIVKDKNGKVVWNLKVFQDFIKQNSMAPSTVNPSLWRQSKLLMYSGLFKVVDGVYQIRGADLSNMTIVEGKNGITIYDPLISAETAKYALDLYYQHRPKKPVVAVVYSHSHADHFGGVKGIVSEADVKDGKVKIYAPEGFMEHAIAENVYAGTAMSRRASYMYGNAVPVGLKGQVGAGLGVTTSSGTFTIIPPTDIIKTTGEKKIIDGLEYQFVMAPDSEAPSEMMWYIPKYKLINTAEDSTHTMHNLYTLRGAKTRDAQKWPNYLNEVIRTYGHKYEVEIGMHHWPTWGQDEITKHIKAQRDTYKFIHDQTLHYANMGYTMNELPSLVQMPKGLVNNWSTHGYYGSKSHNVRAVYNFYLGYFDGVPAHLNPLPATQEGAKFVEEFGADTLMKIGQKALKNGEYRWGAQIVNKLVFAQPKNQEAKNLLADLYEQMGYQAEDATWRNFYLAGTQELRNGVKKIATPNTSSIDVISNMDLDLIFGYMGVQLDSKKAKGKNITINWDFTDTKQEYTLFLENSVLNAWPNYQEKNADVTVRLTRETLNQLLVGELSFQEAQKKELIKFDGDSKKFYELLGSLVNLNKYFWFNIVTP